MGKGQNPANLYTHSILFGRINRFFWSRRRRAERIVARRQIRRHGLQPPRWNICAGKSQVDPTVFSKITVWCRLELE